MCYSSKNRLRHWQVSAKRALTPTPQVCYLMVFYTTYISGQMQQNCWEDCCIFNESAVFDLPMFIIFDVKLHSREKQALDIVQHEDRLIHYPLTEETCCWEVHPGGLLLCNRHRYLLKAHRLLAPALWPLWGNACECRRNKCMRGYVKRANLNCILFWGFCTE